MHRQNIMIRKKARQRDIKPLLIPKDPMDNNNVIIEMSGRAAKRQPGQVVRRMYYRLPKAQVEGGKIDIKETELAA